MSKKKMGIDVSTSFHKIDYPDLNYRNTFNHKYSVYFVPIEKVFSKKEKKHLREIWPSYDYKLPPDFWMQEYNKHDDTFTFHEYQAELARLVAEHDALKYLGKARAWLHRKGKIVYVPNQIWKVATISDLKDALADDYGVKVQIRIRSAREGKNNEEVYYLDEIRLLLDEIL